MNDSDIFNEYAKLAIAQGLVSIGEEEEEPKSKKYDKLSDDAVRLLYGIEPETVFGDKSILEAAHPDTYSVGRSYDAMNSVVETLQQRQDMMTYIATKTPDGLATHRRYIKAHTDLKNSLIRAGFLLDNKEEMELMSFADGCTARLVKKAQLDKTAAAHVVPILIGVGIVAALSGAAYLWNGATSATNVKSNAMQALQALQPLNNKSYAANIEKEISALVSASDKFIQHKNKVAQIITVKGELTPAQKADLDKIAISLKEYAEKLDEVYSQIGNLDPPTGWIAAIKLESSSEERSDLWAKWTDFTRNFIWTDEAKLIEKLVGEGNWMSSGSSGGLKEAIGKDKAVISATVQSMERKMKQPQTPAPQGAPSGKPLPTPAPKS